MSFSIGDNLLVYLPAGDHSPQAANIGNGMTLEVVTSKVKVFLPSQEFPVDSKERQGFLSGLASGEQFHVRVIDSEFVHKRAGGSPIPQCGSAVGRLVVSRKQFLLEDPWKEEVPLWEDIKAVKRLQVRNVHGNFIYGEITPLVEGLVDLRELRQYLGQKVANPVLIGDYLIGYAGPTDYANRLVQLDVVSYLRHLDANLPSAETASVPPVQVATVSSPPHDLRASFGTALVVDDKTDYRCALEDHLKENGLHVHSAHDFASALNLLDKLSKDDAEMDVALLDINLGSSQSGMELAKHIRELRPDIRVLLMSGDATLTEKLSQAYGSGLLVHGFLAKPFGARQLRAELAKVTVARPAPLSSFLVSNEASVDLKPRWQDTKSEGLIECRVQSFRERVRADQAALFAIHRINLQTGIRAGDSPPNPHVGPQGMSWKQKLGHSPVRDVALDLHRFLERDAKHADRFPRNRWLQLAYGYGSCLGIPVVGGDERAYCLFAFSAQPNAFTASDRYAAEACAAELAALLEKDRLLDSLENSSRYVTSGITLGVLAHELMNHLSAAALTSASLLGMDGRQRATMSAVDWERLVNRIHQTVERSVQICDLFKQLAKQGAATTVRIRDCIHQAEELVRQTTLDMNTDLFVAEVSEDLLVKAEPVAVELALFNLFMNAAEQNKEFGRRRGAVTVRAEEQLINGRPQVRILVKDNGPGIHRCWWEKVFEPGFTTKEEGSGLGLHICRRVVEKLKGTVEILSSDMWAGTVFCLTIPRLKK